MLPSFWKTWCNQKDLRGLGVFNLELMSKPWWLNGDGSYKLNMLIINDFLRLNKRWAITSCLVWWRSISLEQRGRSREMLLAVVLAVNQWMLKQLVGFDSMLGRFMKWFICRKHWGCSLMLLVVLFGGKRRIVIDGVCGWLKVSVCWIQGFDTKVSVLNMMCKQFRV